MKVKLQVGVTTVFTLIAILMNGSTVAYLYHSNHSLALETAHSAMQSAQQNTIAEIVNVLEPVAQVVETMGAYVSAFPKRSKTYTGAGVIAALAENLPQVYSLYYADEETGDFYQVIKLPSSIKKFGPNKQPLPKGARFVYRAIFGPNGKKQDSYMYKSSWGNQIGWDVVTATYDPKTRPWYKGAMEQAGIYSTKMYQFISTGNMGMTFAKRVLDKDGKLLGVVGADLTLNKVVDILNDIRIGQDGQVFMLNGKNQLLAYTGTRRENRDLRFMSSRLIESGTINDSVIAKAVEHWTSDRPIFFDFVEGASFIKYLGSAAPIPDIHGFQPTLGFVVPEDHFVGAIKQTTTRVLEISAFIFVISLFLIFLVSRLISRQLNEVTIEAGKISAFQLDTSFELKSPIYEVDQLSSAVSNMKRGLQSFGAYVPTGLVRSIIASGEDTEIGGEDRELTIMFSDIEGFTKKTEDLVPEDLMSDLSEYFAAMENEIAKYEGTIDKYIGDAIMAFWNAPTSDDEHAYHGCRAVLACCAAERNLNQNSTSDSKLLPLRTRFGLHCDEVVVGNVGSLSRLQYTALGSAVNLASRIEGLNKVYGTSSLITENIVKKVDGQFLLRIVDLVSPAGMSRPIRIYELIGEYGAEDAALAATKKQIADIAAWDACYQLYHDRKWDDALAAFEAYKPTTSYDVLVDLYIDRCREFIETPPPDDWDRVQNFEKK